ncbi:MAG: HAMP domain-containing sensor histidine kinase [Candidatus Electrothrix scaldis]|nr:MAG: HAMP domain-containing sensor histidine kinase [Candidatus Electrothrix sp. GW3-3]
MSLSGSIRGRLLLWIFLAGSCMVLLLDFVLLHRVQEGAFQSIDNILHSKLQLMKGLIHAHGDYVEVELAEVARGEYSLPNSGHYYQVFIQDELYMSSPSLQPRQFNLISDRPESHNEEAGEWVYRTSGPNNEPLLVLRNDFDIKGKVVSVRIAESLVETLNMLSSVERFFCVLTPFFFFLTGVVGYFVSSHALRPLTTFGDALEQITHKNLNERIGPNGFASELHIFAERFNSLLERLQTAFEAEKELIANAAHELKTPLAVIRAECDITLMKERSVEEYAESLREVKTVSDTMLRQVNGMLTLARLDAGILSTSFQPITINHCLDNAVRLVAPLAKEHQVGIRREEKAEVTVLGDKEALTEALSNLLENAVYYNRPEGSISVLLQLQGEGKQVMLSIEDTGIGIPEEELEQVFQKFYRSENVQTIKGTGLGLSITRAIVLGHQGDIQVRNVKTGGVCFTINLPLYASGQRPGQKNDSLDAAPV